MDDDDTIVLTPKERDKVLENLPEMDDEVDDTDDDESEW